MPQTLATPTGHVMVLHQGEDAFAALKDFAAREHLPGATFTGLGFAGRAVFGFFDFEKREYEPRAFTNLEMGSLTGSIAWEAGAPSIHMHGTGAGPDFAAVAGHLLELVVGTGSIELALTATTARLTRRFDESLGAKVLELPGRLA